MNNKINRQFKFSAIALSLSMLIAPTASSQTLEQAVAHTLDTNPELKIVFNRFKAREEQVNQAVSGYMPTVNISAR